MASNPILTTEERTALMVEYGLVAESWRFLTGLRFALLAFAATMLSALQGAYQYFLTNEKTLGDLGQTALQVIPFFGIISTLAVIAIEARTRILYGCLLERGTVIEAACGNTIQHFQLLYAARLPLGFASHTLGLRLIYGMLFLTWVYLTYR